MNIEIPRNDTAVFNPLTKTQKDLWLMALRSGRYLQGSMKLKRTVCTNEGTLEDSYCCLGVLNEVCGLESNSHTELIGNRHFISLSHIHQNKLMHLNDTLAWDFGKIADWIEENIEAIDDPV